MPVRLRLALMLCAYLGVAAPREAIATLVRPLDLAALTDGAERIVMARVEQLTPRATAGGASVYTEVTLRVSESIKGDGVRAGDALVVLREGGELDGVGVRVIGAPAFREGEEVLVFLERRGAARSATMSPSAPLYVMGMAQGKLRIEQRADRRVVVRRREGLSFTAAAAVEPFVEPLDDVLRKVRDRLESSGAGPRK